MMTSLLALWQGQEAATHGVVEGAPPDLERMRMHHLTDGNEIELEILGRGFTFHLPQWDPIHIGQLTLDLSPTKHTVFMLIAAVLLVLVFVAVGRVMQRKYRDKAPSGFANAMEAMVLYFRDEIVRRNIGKGADGYTSYILTLFFFILFMNLLGLLPFGSTATGNLSVTGALAILSFVVVEVTGMVKLGAAGYAKTIFYVPPGLSPAMGFVMLMIMTPVEFLGKLTKPFTLAIRLFANMVAGHTLVLSLLGMIFMFTTLTFGKWAIAGASVVMVVAFSLLEIFVAFLQAYIFAMLTSVFIGMMRHAH